MLPKIFFHFQKEDIFRNELVSSSSVAAGWIYLEIHLCNCDILFHSSQVGEKVPKSFLVPLFEVGLETFKFDLQSEEALSVHSLIPRVSDDLLEVPMPDPHVLEPKGISSTSRVGC